MSEQITRDAVRITKAADYPGAWYVIPATIGLTFQMPYSTDTTFQLVFYVGSADEAFADLFRTEYAIVDDPMFTHAICTRGEV